MWLLSPPPRTKWTRRVPHPVLIGHAVLRGAQVPKGHMWLLGDNLENSSDSRSYGAVPIAMLYGHVWMRVRPRALRPRTCRSEVDACLCGRRSGARFGAAAGEHSRAPPWADLAVTQRGPDPTVSAKGQRQCRGDSTAPRRPRRVV